MKDLTSIGVLVGIVCMSGWLGQVLIGQPRIVVVVLGALVALCIVGARRIR